MANKIYTAPETAITFLASGGSAVFSPTSLGDQAGRVSDRYDRGAGSRAAWYLWRSWCKAFTAATVTRSVGVYLSSSDGTISDGNFGTADAAIAATLSFALYKCANLIRLGAMIADNDPSQAYQRSGFIYLPARYVSVYWFNDLGVGLSGTALDHGFSLTPVPDEIQ